MAKHFEFNRDDVFPSWFPNQLQELLSAGRYEFALKQIDADTVGVTPPSEPGNTAIVIDGKWRYRTTAVTRDHPGGAAGTYDVWAVAEDNDYDNAPLPHSDHTNYSFDLRITATGVDPAGAGVEIWDKVGEIEWSGAAITRVTQTGGGGLAAPPIDRQVFTASGTWKKPTAPAGCAPYSVVEVRVVGGGGGGGSGRRGAAGTLRLGGGGGGSGRTRDATLPLALPGGTEVVTVGAGGAGGAARAVNDTDGANGAAGGVSSFGAHVAVTAADGGQGGNAAQSEGGIGGSGGAGQSGAASTQAGTGGKDLAAPGGQVGGGASESVPGGGGGYGSQLTVGNAAILPMAGGAGHISAGGAAPGGGGVAGGAGGAAPAGSGSGGGGGGGGGTQANSTGGAGGIYGGGGGGGGASLNGANSGAGGVGGAGIVIVVTR